MRRFAALLALAAAGACTSTVTPPRRPPRTPAAAARPAATPTPHPTVTPVPAPPSPPPPAPAPASDVAPPLVRVLLVRSRGAVRFPQPGRPYRASWDGGAAWVWGPLEVTPVAETVWQVGAWRDAAAAAAALRKLEAGLGGEAEVERSTGDDGLTRVRVRWASPPAAPGRLLAALGFTDAYPVRGAGSLRLEGMAGESIVAPRIDLEPTGDWPTAVGTRSYRGRFHVRASAGSVLLINELNLESYLRGVVPAEMGPSAFPELEALKAQAVAARTYTVAHLGDHADEGYDICATPACQVYRGVGVEHRLSDRAVRETAGLIATYGGRPIDAMYTSTCGGHTEDAAALFPERAAPYLKGVACAWERKLELAGEGRPAGWESRTAFEAEIASRVLGLGGDPQPGAVAAAVARLCNGRAALGREGTVEDFARRLLDAAGLGRAAAVLGGGGSAVQQVLDLADLYGAPLDPPHPDDWRRTWSRAAALAVLQVQGVVSFDRGEAVPRAGGPGIFPRRAEASEPLPAVMPLYERWRDAYRALAHAEVLPGTTLERWRRGDEVLALAVVRSGGGGEADRRSAWRHWTREMAWSQLARRLGMPDLEKIEITARSASGRVVGLRAQGRSGRVQEWSGFDVRRVLGLPETLFTFHRLRRPDGTEVVRFLGRGWGHGVGLCQNGAYGLARAGMTFDRILATYYPGITLTRWPQER